jgi:hypothetical protein
VSLDGSFLAAEFTSALPFDQNVLVTLRTTLGCLSIIDFAWFCLFCSVWDLFRVRTHFGNDVYFDYLDTARLPVRKAKLLHYENGTTPRRMVAATIGRNLIFLSVYGLAFVSEFLRQSTWYVSTTDTLCRNITSPPCCRSQIFCASISLLLSHIHAVCHCVATSKGSLYVVHY